jgi:hypothetical protein
MQILKTFGFCVVAAAGLAVVYASPVEKTSVPPDYLVRPMDAADAALKSTDVLTLSDWEYTARLGRPVCRFAR